MNARVDPARVLATYGTALAAAALFGVFAVAASNFLNPTNLLNVLTGRPAAGRTPDDWPIRLGRELSGRGDKS